MTDDDPELRDRLQAQAVAVLQGIPHRRREIDEDERLLIANARNEGVTWKRIAEALGLGSPQAAKQRYGHLCERAAPATGQPCQVCGGPCGIVCEKEARQQADTEFDQRVAESINRLFVKADDAGYVYARMER